MCLHAVMLLIALARPAFPASPADRDLARDILRQLIEIDTTHSTGNTTTAAEAMAARFRSARVPDKFIRVLGPVPNRGNLVVHYPGTSSTKKPVLLLAHLDVVEARREDWSVDPFRFLERDGFFYGRGTGDDKGLAALWVANLIRFHREGYRPERGLILALTADEESGGRHNGADWLVNNHRDLVNAEWCLNEGGFLQLKNGKPAANQVQVAEKVTLNLTLELRNRGGHASVPRRDNAIYRLGRALQRLEEFEFPVETNDATRAYFQRMAAVEAPLAADMRAVASASDPQAARRLSGEAYYNALLRTTCTATRLEAGHADNALPQTARATVNCRILPGAQPAAVIATLERVLRDPEIAIARRNDPRLSSPSALDPRVLSAVESATNATWPGVPVVPVMLTGGTDGKYLRNAGIPTYGVTGLAEDPDDLRWHGRDERISSEAFYNAQDFLYRLMKEIATK